MPLETTALLSVAQVAEHLGIHEQTVRKLIRAGDLVATPIGRRVLVHPRELDDFIDRHTGVGVEHAS
jgi:excisionase family DNA binding protein